MWAEFLKLGSVGCSACLNICKRKLVYPLRRVVLFDIVAMVWFYAVRRGKQPGIYKTWPECQEQIKDFKGARYKKFPTEEEAQAFVDGTDSVGISKKKDETNTSRKRVKDDNDQIEKKYNDQDQKKQKTEVAVAEEEVDPDAPRIYTDGCCIFNGKKGACAGIGVYWGPDHAKNVSERVPGRQTNNRAEILAACKALKQVKEMGKNSAVIYTDSQFLINGASKWLQGWKKKGWKLSNGGDVKNREEFEHLDDLLKDMKIAWIHVPGHQGNEGNEAADKLAIAGAKKDLSEDISE